MQFKVCVCDGGGGFVPFSFTTRINHSPGDETEKREGKNKENYSKRKVAQ